MILLIIGFIYFTSAIQYNTCLGLAVLSSLAYNASVSDVNAPACPTVGNNSSPEALVLHDCIVPPLANWTPGQKVSRTLRYSNKYVNAVVKIHG